MKKVVLFAVALLLALALIGGGWKWGGNGGKHGQGVMREAGWAWNAGGERAMFFPGQ